MSHQRAAAATADGRLTAEIAPWFGGAGDGRDRHGATTASAPTPRSRRWRSSGRSSTGATARSRPATSSPLTDGAAAVLLMAEDKAAALGYEPLAFLRSYAVAAVDPGWQLLMGPVYAVPRALERAGIGWGDLGPGRDPRGVRGAGALQRAGLGLAGLGRAAGAAGPVGEVDWERTNVMGGSIAIGHPVRRHRRAPGDDARERDGAPRRAVRADLDLRAGRHGRRARAGARPECRRFTTAIENGIAVVTFDLPGEPVNKLSDAVKVEFEALLDPAPRRRGDPGRGARSRASPTASSPAPTSRSSPRSPPRARPSG